MKANVSNLLKVLAMSMLPLICSTSCDEKEKAPETLLWKLEYGGRQSWLFGTIHVPDKAFERMPGEIKCAIASADLFFTEMEPDNQNQLEVSRKMMLPENQSLLELIGRDRFSKVEKITQGFEGKVSPTFLNRCKIWAASLLIAYPKGNDDIPLDILLYQKARSLGKETRGIETPGEQVGCLDTFTVEEQIQILDDAIREAEEGFSNVNGIRKDYLSQNLSGIMEKFIAKESEMSPELKEKYLSTLLVSRNRLFFERLLPEFKSRNVFAAVGTGHLLGEESLLSLFEDAGFKLTPVFFKFEEPEAIPGARLLHMLLY